MKNNKFVVIIIFSCIIYAIVSIAYYIVQEKMYMGAMQIYSFEMFCLPVIFLCILLLKEKEKKQYIFLFDMVYIALGIILLVMIFISRPLSTNNAIEVLQEKGYQKVKCTSSCTKGNYNEVIVAYAGGLGVELPKSKCGVYICEGKMGEEIDTIIVYLENGEWISLSGKDEGVQLKNLLNSLKNE